MSAQTSDSYNCATCGLALASPNAPCPNCLRDTGNPWPHLKNPLVDLVDKPGLGAAMRHAIEQATVARTSNERLAAECLEFAATLDALPDMDLYARLSTHSIAIILREAGQALQPPAPETEALPSIEELWATPPPGAEERLANAISTSMRLETLSNQALVDMALDGCFEESPTATLVLHEMCSRLHPGWENEDPEGNSPSKKASEPSPNDALCWICPRCTTVNGIEDEVCVCRGRRPSQGK
jgi:hypothetical protein